MNYEVHKVIRDDPWFGEVRSLRGLKTGDVVFVAFHSGKRCEREVKVGREYGYISQLERFDLDTGLSVDAKDSNCRANGWGFDVFRSEDEFNEAVRYKKLYLELSQALIENGRLKRLSMGMVESLLGELK